MRILQDILSKREAKKEVELELFKEIPNNSLLDFLSVNVLDEPDLAEELDLLKFEHEHLATETENKEKFGTIIWAPHSRHAKSLRGIEVDAILYDGLDKDKLL